MTIQTINLGNYANDGTGDDLRVAFDKVNKNFAALNTSAAVVNGYNLGPGIGIFANKNLVNLEFKTLTSLDNSVTITDHTSDHTIDLLAKTILANDPAPQLGANLNLGSKYVYGGDIRTTVYGFDVNILNSIVSMLLACRAVRLDVGTIPFPTGYSPSLTRGFVIDMGSFLFPSANRLDFGTLV
jgi:hypothetical protein